MSSDPQPRPLPAPPDGRRAAALRRRLLDWYADARRDLPWRRTRDPYAIWISEAMLQQTRVETVVPYWRRFTELFPDVRTLASAGDEQLLAAWSGLGYYRRARALREAARLMIERHGGEFPRDREAALALPGVGPYTAGAVLSIAHGLRQPIVDGNVARVFCRLFALDAPADSSDLRRELWRFAEALLPRRAGPGRGPGAWNQGLMELGALVCTPRDPSCGECPLARSCLARARGLQLELPRPATRRAEPIEVELEVLLVVARRRLLLARRPERGRMAGLLELPTRELGSAYLWPTELPQALELGPELGVLRHGITQHRIRARVRTGRLGGRSPREPLAWFGADRLGELGLTGLARKILDRPFARVALDPAAPRGGAGSRR